MMPLATVVMSKRGNIPEKPRRELDDVLDYSRRVVWRKKKKRLKGNM